MKFSPSEISNGMGEKKNRIHIRRLRADAILYIIKYRLIFLRAAKY
jgi:hypothetical protein